MIRCLNALNYDAWVIGNHDFDWGVDTLADSIRLSAMPVLSGNALIEGHPAGGVQDTAHPLAQIRPWFLKEIAGFRIAIVGLTTPGLSAWLPPEDLRGFEALDPLESLRDILREVGAQRPDAIVVAGHMGLKRSDDFANQVGALTREFPQLTAYLGGHTHQNHSSDLINGVLYTQADHYGIYAGKIDLTFDRESRRLIHRVAVTVPMDHQVPLDPLVLSLSRGELDVADRLLAREVGELTEPFGVVSTFGRPCETERLIGSAMIDALRARNVGVDAVVHGLFDDKHPLEAGGKTVADMWTILPYENQIVTLELSAPELLALAQELAGGRDVHQLMGLRVVTTGRKSQLDVTALLAADGSPLPPKSSYRVALNSYDSQSGGQRFPVLGQWAARPSSRRVLYPIQIRDALTDFFLARKKVGRSSLLV
jgi:2',3'-cyclic-nucleotide 2'-phosphodiesterase/3'-nucleotidase